MCLSLAEPDSWGRTWRKSSTIVLSAPQPPPQLSAGCQAQTLQAAPLQPWAAPRFQTKDHGVRGASTGAPGCRSSMERALEARKSPRKRYPSLRGTGSQTLPRGPGILGRVSREGQALRPLGNNAWPDSEDGVSQGSAVPQREGPPHSPGGEDGVS